MKNLFIPLCLLATLWLSGCDSNELSSREAAIKKLTDGPWSASEVTHASDGDLTSQYEDFSLVLIESEKNSYDGTFFTANGFIAFPETSGLWRLNEGLTDIVFENGRTFKFSFDKDDLILTFEVPPSDGGRTNGVSGNFTFRLTH